MSGGNLRRRRLMVVGIAGIAAVAASVAGLVIGAVPITVSEVAAVVARRLGFAFGDVPAVGADAVVWTIRMPRVLLGLVTGAGLAATGVALQGVLRNPLGDPHLLGIGPGSAIGAAVGAIAGGVQGSIAGGAAAGVLTALLLRRLARRNSSDPARFVLVGVALGAALTAWVGFVVFGADRSVVPPMEFWLLGSLSAATWRALGTAVVVIAVAVAVLLIAGRSLDLLALGERQAAHVGVDVDLTVTVILMTVGVITGATVGAVGVVGFVGLVVPNVMRRLVGPQHRFLTVASMLAGGTLLVAADLVARTLLSPVEIGVGLVTALVGGPFLLVLLRRPGLA